MTGSQTCRAHPGEFPNRQRRNAPGCKRDATCSPDQAATRETGMSEFDEGSIKTYAPKLYEPRTPSDTQPRTEPRTPSETPPQTEPRTPREEQPRIGPSGNEKQPPTVPAAREKQPH